MSKKVDRILEEDINKNYRTSVTFEDIKSSVGENEFVYNQKNNLFKKKLKPLLITSLIFIIAVFNILVLKESYLFYNINVGLLNKMEHIVIQNKDFNRKLIDESMKKELLVLCDEINLKPALVIYSFEDVYISIYCGKKSDTPKDKLCYLVLIEYISDYKDVITITVEDKEVIRTNEKMIDIIHVEEEDENVSNNYVEFIVTYHNISKQFSVNWEKIE